MSAATSSEEKRTKLKKLDVLGDDFDAVPDSEIKGIMSALQQIRVKAQSDGQKKSEQTISSEASELKSSHGELKASLGQDKRGTTIICIMDNGFVVMGVDSNSTSGGKVVKSDMMKLINICDGVFAAHAGYVNVGEVILNMVKWFLHCHWRKSFPGLLRRQIGGKI